MSIDAPKTVEEWAQYISTLHGETLWAKGVAANTLQFVMALQEEGSTPSDITDVLILFGLQFEKDDQASPRDMPGQYLSYPDLLDSVEKNDAS